MGYYVLTVFTFWKLPDFISETCVFVITEKTVWFPVSWPQT